MSEPALVIRPGDWMLGIWWASWPTVNAHRGGEWFAWGRRDSVELGKLPVWHFWQYRRRHPDTAWMAEMVVWHKPAGVMIERAKLYREIECQKILFMRGGIDVHGDGAELVRRIEAGATLPSWLSLLVIEQRQAQHAP